MGIIVIIVGIIVIIVGIILLILGVKKENKLLRNIGIGIVIALIGCILTAASPQFLDGFNAGLDSSMGK